MPKKSNKMREDGRIRVGVYLGRVEGRAKYKYFYGKTQKEAQEKADSYKAKLKKGLDLSHENDSFATWCDRWLSMKQCDIGHSQYLSYICYAKHLKQHLGGVPINKIKAYDIQELINQLAAENPSTKRPTAKKTLTDIKNTASQVFRFAVENRVLEYNPADAVRVPKNAAKSERRALTDVEQAWIEDTPHRMQCAAMIMMYAGLRRGELIPLTWADVNLKKRTISINKSVDFSSGKPEVKRSTKTAAGIRVVNIPVHLCDYLSQQRRTSTLVCSSLSNGMYTADSWASSWESYLFDLDILYGTRPQKKSKFDKRYPGITIPRITPHWLRHTFCTMMYLAGVDVLTAKEQMGHADVKTTLAIYTHLTDAHREKEISKLDEFLKHGSTMGQVSPETIEG